MVRDDDHCEDFSDLCLENLTYNDNVISQASYEPDVVDDEDAWYNFLYDSE